MVAVALGVVAQAQQRAKPARVEELEAPQIDDDLVEAHVAQAAHLLVDGFDAGHVELADENDGDLLAIGRDDDGERLGSRTIRHGLNGSQSGAGARAAPAGSGRDAMMSP